MFTQYSRYSSELKTVVDLCALCGTVSISQKQENHCKTTEAGSNVLSRNVQRSPNTSAR